MYDEVSMNVQIQEVNYNNKETSLSTKNRRSGKVSFSPVFSSMIGAVSPLEEQAFRRVRGEMVD